MGVIIGIRFIRLSTQYVEISGASCALVLLGVNFKTVRPRLKWGKGLNLKSKVSEEAGARWEGHFLGLSRVPGTSM